MRSVICLILLLIFSYHTAVCQPDSDKILVSGKVYDYELPQLPLQFVMIVNLTTQQGIFANPDQSFSLTINRSDTIAITATGYAVRKISFRDSSGTSFRIYPALHRLTVELRPVDIFQKRNPAKIEEDLKSLGYNPREYKLNGLEAWGSPITALYQSLNKKERSKRRVAELENIDERNALLRELLRMYKASDLIELSDSEYDRFIEHLGLTDLMLNTFTQYELAVYIKEKYQGYMNRGGNY